MNSRSRAVHGLFKLNINWKIHNLKRFLVGVFEQKRYTLVLCQFNTRKYKYEYLRRKGKGGANLSETDGDSISIDHNRPLHLFNENGIIDEICTQSCAVHLTMMN